jgi:hypothetical protein
MGGTEGPRAKGLSYIFGEAGGVFCFSQGEARHATGKYRLEKFTTRGRTLMLYKDLS